MHLYNNTMKMKKAMCSILVAVAAMLFVSCDKKAEVATPPEDAYILAGDVTVQEGNTVQIDAATNSSAAISYVADNSGVYTVNAAGLVTGVKAGSGQLLLKVDAVEGQYTAAEKTVSVTVTAATPVDDGAPKAGTYSFTASSLKGKWVAGDQIYVHCGWGPAAQMITLEASQISADGKTATAELGGDLFKYLTSPDPLYAVWPADAVKKEDGLTGEVITFAVSDILLTQAYLKEGNFAFKDISSSISFKVSGGFDRFMIAGTQRPGLRYSGYKNEYSSVKITPAKPKDDGYPFREEALGADGSTTIWFPGGMNFYGGFTLYFATGDNWTASYSYTQNAELKAGRTLDLGDITGQLEAYNGPKPHMPEMIDCTKYAVSFNELSGICVDLSGDFVWALGDGSQICQISLGGELLSKANLKTTNGSTLDSEGLSINYDTGDILISGEPNAVYKIPYAQIDNIFLESTFRGVETLTSIADAKSFGNSGAEGCTYYKEGLAYIGTQTGSYLYLYDLATGEVLWRKGLREMHSVITEIAGLCYDPLTDWLWVIDSESHKFFALSGDAETLLGAYTLKTKSNEESICVDHKNSCVWVGDDYGSTSYVYKYEFTGLDDFILPEN